MQRFTNTLRSRKFDGVNIGYGVRGHKGMQLLRILLDRLITHIAFLIEHTELFEKMLNQSWAITPGIKIMFSNGPQEDITAIKRNIPESF